MKVALIGSLTLDTVYIIDNLSIGGSHLIKQKSIRAGGIGNLSRFMEEVHNVVPVCFYDSESPVTIVVDKAKSERTIFVEQDDCRYSQLTYWDDIKEFDWCHIAYIDIMENLTVDHMKRLRKHNKVISVDFCLTTGYTKHEARRVYELLEYVDVIFISGDNLNAFNQSGLDLSLYELKDQIGITHHKGHIIYVDGNNSYSYEYEPTPNLNTLGAGDYFAASLICQSLANFKSPEQLLEDAHADTLHFLKENNDD